MSLYVGVLGPWYLRASELASDHKKTFFGRPCDLLVDIGLYWAPLIAQEVFGKEENDGSGLKYTFLQIKTIFE